MATTAFHLLIQLMEKKTCHSLDEKEILRYLVNGNFATTVETMLGRPLTYHDERIIRLMDTSYFIGFYRGATKSGPLDGSGCMEHHMESWGAYRHLSSLDDQEIMKQLLKASAYLGLGLSTEQWTEALTKTSPQPFVARTITALYKLEHELFRAELVQLKKETSSLSQALKIVMGEDSELAITERFDMRLLFGPGNASHTDPDQNFANRCAKLYEHKKLWPEIEGNGPTNYSARTEIQSLMDAFREGLIQAFIEPWRLSFWCHMQGNFPGAECWSQG